MLSHATALLGEKFAVRSSVSDEYGNDFSIGKVVIGSTHDDCFFTLKPHSARLKRALLESVLALHSGYLKKDIDWSGVVERLLDLWTSGTTLQMRAIHRPTQIDIKVFSNDATFFEKLFTQSVNVVCVDGRAVVR